MKKNTTPQEPAKVVSRYSPDFQSGLSNQQVNERIESKLTNYQPPHLTRPVSKIVWSNVLTLFNLLNLVLAAIIVMMGDWKNALFIGVAVANTCIGIFQELRAKKTIDELSILSESKVKVVREGASKLISPNDIVLDDVIFLEQGSQIPTDGTVLHTNGIEIDESLLTGEANQIEKSEGSSVMSGSFVTAGSAYIRVEAVGSDNYAARLSAEAKAEKSKPSKLMKNLNRIIQVLTVIIVPVGAILFYSNYNGGSDFKTSVLGATAAMLGMIPEGLMLLTSVTFAVGAVNLAKHKALVQRLPSIETLARADVLCLDKTGTITDGNLTLEQIIPLDEYPIDDIKTALGQLMVTLDDKNPTAEAIRQVYAKSAGWQPETAVAFSSKRKWSGASYTGIGSYLIGAPDFIFTEISGEMESIINYYSQKGLRVLGLGRSNATIEGSKIPEELFAVGLLVLSDNIRDNAVDTFKYFADEGVEIKVISGDNPVTVSHIARHAGIAGAENYVDMAKLDENTDYQKLAMENTVFGRVSPYQKRRLVKALQANGKTVCMTGDGVNDVLALKEADCGVAMVGGSEAARSVADFVLMDSNFGAMVEVLKEGRRVINNIENVASLYLVKTIYSTIMAVLFIYLPFPYPFAPLQMSPINTLTVGIPSFFLALEANYRKPEGRFLPSVLENSVPAAITVIFNIVIIQLAGMAFNLPMIDTSTMSVLLTGTVGFILLYKVSRPLNWKKGVMIILLIGAFVGIMVLFKGFFGYSGLFNRNVFFYMPLMYSSLRMFGRINQFVVIAESKFINWRKSRKAKQLKKA